MRAKKRTTGSKNLYSQTGDKKIKIEKWNKKLKGVWNAQRTL